MDLEKNGPPDLLGNRVNLVATIEPVAEALRVAAVVVADSDFRVAAAPAAERAAAEVPAEVEHAAVAVVAVLAVVADRTASATT